MPVFKTTPLGNAVLLGNAATLGPCGDVDEATPLGTWTLGDFAEKRLFRIGFRKCITSQIDSV